MIQAQILYSKLQSISREMGYNLQRISRSPLLSQDRAFATALFTPELELAVQHQYEPEHLYAVKDSVAQLFDYFSFDIADGDVLIVADPYRGGTKGQSLTMAAPLFLEGELVLFPVIRAQMIDLAGEYPGGFHPEAFEIWQENVRITPIKLYKQGVLQADILNFLLSNSRMPSSFKADLEAMYTCLREAREQLEGLIESSGMEAVDSSIESLFQYSQNRVKNHISNLQDTEMAASVEFGITPDDRNTIAVRIQASADSLTVDVSESSAQSEKPINSPAALTKAFAVWPFLAMIADEVPINEGLMRSFTVLLKSGTICDPAFPAATALAPGITGHFLAEAVYRAIKSSGNADQFPPIYGTGPQAIFYPELGVNEETEPIVLVPGFPAAQQGFGPPALFGERLLVSAEELELYHGFKMISREWKNAGLEVVLENQEDDVYFNLLLPSGKDDRFGSVTIEREKSRKIEQSATNQHVKKGDLLVFVYAGKGQNE
ncbi:hydantoinase B/oxoprolinase family protein [Sporosarcina sp. P33]|uniref:hydantoinase B/oxoprolinase family protein n=1 Tax=Sporosarcina sp. P33 TaxID=1930764 RepID=UPI0009C093B7|nr:hydantoinase B/oxoprolinase family protein [Sporosarcina sp. P33]ARD48862.1 methylhydantoinase [Sporosarcina sp. P33]